MSAIALILFAVIAWRFRLEQRRHQFSRLQLDKTKLIEEIRLTLKNARQLLKTIDIALLLVLFAYLGNERFSKRNEMSDIDRFRFVTDVFRRRLRNIDRTL